MANGVFAPLQNPFANNSSLADYCRLGEMLGPAAKTPLSNEKPGKFGIDRTFCLAAIGHLFPWLSPLPFSSL
jgi:hypothetical protein